MFLEFEWGTIDDSKKEIATVDDECPAWKMKF